jgi:predicted kinase
MIEREQSGYVRECHGDLHCANIVRSGHGLVPFDCIDFDPDLRWIDVMSDIGFLVMDLTSRERSDLACALLTRYLETTGDYAGVRLLPFYVIYRALVRANVDAITAGQLPDRAAELQDRLRRRVLTAIQWMDRPCPTLILMHGVSGSGKSWLSERLVAALPALRVRSDLERKRLAGANTHPGGSAGLYSPAVNHRTYAHLCECAESCLQAGFHTIVDAAFLDAADRELLRGLATRLGVRSIIVSCQVDPATLSARVQHRHRQGSDPSDADQTVLEAQLRKLQPLTAEEQLDAIVVDTRNKDAVLKVAAAVAH